MCKVKVVSEKIVHVIQTKITYAISSQVRTKYISLSYLITIKFLMLQLFSSFFLKEQYLIFLF